MFTFLFVEQQSNFPQSQTGAGYPTQAGHTYQQAGYVPSKSPVKYNPGGQSAFSSYSNPYTHPQTKQLQEAGYPAYRMQQPSGTKLYQCLFSVSIFTVQVYHALICFSCLLLRIIVIHCLYWELVDLDSFRLFVQLKGCQILKITPWSMSF